MKKIETAKLALILLAKQRERDEQFFFLSQKRKSGSKTALSLEEKRSFFLLQKNRPSLSKQKRIGILSQYLATDKDRKTHKEVREKNTERSAKKSSPAFYALGLSLSPPPPNLGRRNSRILRFSLERTRTTLEWMAAEMQ